MKRQLFLAFVSTSLLFGAPQPLADVQHDTKAITAFTKENIQTLLKAVNKVKILTKKAKKLDEDLQRLNNNTQFACKSKKDAKKALETVKELSFQILFLAKTTAFLASHHTSDARQPYLDALADLIAATRHLCKNLQLTTQQITTKAKKIEEISNTIIATQKTEAKNYRSACYLSDAASRIVKRQIAIVKENDAQPAIPKRGGYAF